MNGNTIQAHERERTVSGIYPEMCLEGHENHEKPQTEQLIYFLGPPTHQTTQYHDHENHNFNIHWRENSQSRMRCPQKSPFFRVKQLSPSRNYLM